MTHDPPGIWVDAVGEFALLAETSVGLPLEELTLASEAFQMLRSKKVIEQGIDAGSAYCPRCRVSHDVNRTDDGTYSWICCDGEEPIPYARVRRWKSNWRNTASWLADSLGLASSVRHVRQGQIAYLGELEMRRVSVPIWLVRGLGNAQTLTTLLAALAQASPRRKGLILSPVPTPHLALPNGSSCLGFNAFVDPNNALQPVSVSEVWRAGFGTIGPKAGKRGNPGKAGNPVAEFKDRVRNGKALRRIGEEAQAIQKLERSRFGRGNELSESDIANKIRPVFHAWKAAEYPEDFFDPD